MKIALFASAFHPHFGGVEEHVRQVAVELRAAGQTPIVVTNRWPPALPVHDEVDGIAVYRMAMRMPEGTWRERLKYRLTQTVIRRGMLRELRNQKIDLVHVHCVSTNGFWALEAHREMGLPLIVSTHGERTMDATGLYERSPLINQVLKQLTARADYVTACSRFTMNDLEQWNGRGYGSRGQVVYNGIHVREFREAVAYEYPRPYVLAVGRLVKQKGFEFLLRGFAEAIVAGLNDHDLLMAGDGPERRMLENMASALEIGPRVKFLGKTDHAMTARLFKGCSMFVLSSPCEPMGIVNLEAMAAGRPVIATNAGGVPEIVLDRQTGWLIAPNDPMAISRALVELGRDVALRQRLGEAAARWADLFTWSRTTQKYVEMYENVVRRRGAADAAGLASPAAPAPVSATRP